MAKYNEEECAVIYRSREKWGALGNMAMGYPIVFDGKTWTSSEALYQACKFENKEHQELVREASNGYMSKQVAKDLPVREGWLDMRVEVMFSVLLLKASQHASVLSLLRETQDVQIVEKSLRDSFWGAQPVDFTASLSGDNKLGKLWMAVRRCIEDNDFWELTRMAELKLKETLGG